MNKFRIFLFLFVIFLCAIVWFVPNIILFSFDAPRNYGSPLTYLEYGCGWRGCVNIFYPIALIVDAVFPITLLVSAYFIGSKYKEALLNKKILISSFYIMIISVVSAVLIFANYSNFTIYKIDREYEDPRKDGSL